MKKSLCFILVLYLLLGVNLVYSKSKNILKEVIFLKEPVERLIFEFETVPKYEINTENNLLKIKLFNTYPGEVSWIRKLPKEQFKEINIALEKDYFSIVMKLEDKFNFKAQTYENKLMVDLIWDQKEIPQAAIIRGEKVFKKPLDEVDKKFFPKYELPSYENQKNVELPFTKVYKGVPISVDFQEADLHAVLRLLAEVGKFNLVVSEKAKGSITLKLHQVPWDQVLDIVLANFGLGMIKIGNVLRIAPIEEIKAESDKYRDYLTSIKDIQERGPLITKTFQLKYIKADKIIDRLREVIGTGGGEGRITYEPFTNLIIAKDTEKNLMEMERVIKEIDKPTKQVLIEARIVEVQDTYAHKLGIRWGGAAWKTSEHTIFGTSREATFKKGGGNETVTVDINIAPVVDLGVAGSTNIGFFFGHLGRSTVLLDIELSALESEGVARIFSSPKIITLDHQEAEIKQGYKIPYLQLTPFGVATTQFLDAVLRLKVIPHITPDNRINLDLEVEKSSPDFGTVVQGVPAILTRYAKTRVLINSGDTLVIGGIKTNDISENLEQVPGLSKIPALEELFKKREKDLRKTELMVFITPRIVSVEIPGLDY
ncbi:MAG: type IV pilus secretin PilQ [Thermodesulfobacteriaceae bacterium]|nr:type IV pilus secretin PilQ [Thermodesulfobacteriaceae bacterium]